MKANLKLTVFSVPKKVLIAVLVVAVVIDVGYLFLAPEMLSNTSSRSKKLKIGMMPIMDCLQLYVAQDRGYFKEQGLEVETVPMSGGAAIAPAVDSGDLDIGWSNTVSIIVAHDKGFSYQFLTPGAFRDSGQDVIEHHLVVGADEQIDSYRDLAGKKVALNTLGNINELVFTAWAYQYNLSLDQFSLVEVPFPQMEATLKNDKIDAAIIIEPFATLSAAHNATKILDRSPYDVISERLMIASWFAKDSWVENNPKAAKSFIRAIEQANEYINNHPQQLPDIVANHTKLDSELARKATLPLFHRDIRQEDLQVLINASKRYEFIEKGFDASKIVYNLSLARNTSS